jgi:hypothetical protein
LENSGTNRKGAFQNSHLSIVSFDLWKDFIASNSSISSTVTCSSFQTLQGTISLKVQQIMSASLQHHDCLSQILQRSSENNRTIQVNYYEAPLLAKSNDSTVIKYSRSCLNYSYPPAEEKVNISHRHPLCGTFKVVRLIKGKINDG